ncbi:hypothetical protein IQ07DRAFT_30388 [Pyrenochaeta sp. DS3sAY3a]|nr:hypothetical protein IQ07DRAFT_30388 [Pyrenochaeta sp. DS3sAY3a]
MCVFLLLGHTAAAFGAQADATSVYSPNPAAVDTHLSLYLRLDTPPAHRRMLSGFHSRPKRVSLGARNETSLLVLIRSSSLRMAPSDNGVLLDASRGHRGVRIAIERVDGCGLAVLPGASVFSNMRPSFWGFWSMGW